MKELTRRERKYAISSEVRFYTIADVKKETGWSEAKVQQLFNDPNFPAADYGRSKVVEAHALIEYFAVRHDKDKERHWKKEGTMYGRRKDI